MYVNIDGSEKFFEKYRKIFLKYILKNRKGDVIIVKYRARSVMRLYKQADALAIVGTMRLPE